MRGLWTQIGTRSWRPPLFFLIRLVPPWCFTNLKLFKRWKVGGIKLWWGMSNLGQKSKTDKTDIHHVVLMGLLGHRVTKQNWSSTLYKTKNRNPHYTTCDFLFERFVKNGHEHCSSDFSILLIHIWHTVIVGLLLPFHHSCMNLLCLDCLL